MFTKLLRTIILNIRFSTLLINDNKEYEDDSSDNELELDNKPTKVKREAIPARILRRENNPIIKRIRKLTDTKSKYINEIPDTKIIFILKKKRR